MASLIQLIETRKETASKTWAKIAAFILLDPNKVTYLKLKEFSEQADVSEGSIINFARSLGYKGYIEFKVGLAQSMGNFANSFILADNGINTFVQISDATKKSLDETLAVLNKDIIEKISTRIAKTKGRVYVCGRSTSGHIANIFAGYLMRLNVPAFSYDDHFAVANSLNENDTMIVISYSGETNDIYEAVKAAKERGAYTVCMSAFPHSKIAALCDDCMECVAVEAKEGNFPIITRIVQLALCDVICARVYVLLKM